MFGLGHGFCLEPRMDTNERECLRVVNAWVGAWVLFGTTNEHEWTRMLEGCEC